MVVPINAFNGPIIGARPPATSQYPVFGTPVQNGQELQLLSKMATSWFRAGKRPQIPAPRCRTRSSSESEVPTSGRRRGSVAVGGPGRVWRPRRGLSAATAAATIGRRSAPRRRSPPLPPSFPTRACSSRVRGGSTVGPAFDESARSARFRSAGVPTVIVSQTALGQNF